MAQQDDRIGCTAQASYLAVLAFSLSQYDEQDDWEALVVQFSEGSMAVMTEAEQLNAQRASEHAALDASLGRQGGYEHLQARIRAECTHLGGLL